MLNTLYPQLIVWLNARLAAAITRLWPDIGDSANTLRYQTTITKYSPVWSLATGKLPTGMPKVIQTQRSSPRQSPARSWSGYQTNSGGLQTLYANKTERRLLEKQSGGLTSEDTPASRSMHRGTIPGRRKSRKISNSHLLSSKYGIAVTVHTTRKGTSRLEIGRRSYPLTNAKTQTSLLNGLKRLGLKYGITPITKNLESPCIAKTSTTSSNSWGTHSPDSNTSGPTNNSTRFLEAA